MNVVVQVNGRKRASIERPAGEATADLIAALESAAEVTAALAGAEVVRVIAPEGKNPEFRVVNYVVKVAKGKPGKGAAAAKK
jgi:hypothetical protein